MPLRLQSTLIRWAFHRKRIDFENALESGSKRKRIHIVLVWTVENASKCKRWPKISQARVFVAYAYTVESSLRHNDPLARRFSPNFPLISCPPVNPRGCTVLHRLRRMATMTFVWMRVTFFENHFNPLCSLCIRLLTEPDNTRENVHSQTI